jgi:hypothetical protein
LGGIGDFLDMDGKEAQLALAGKLNYPSAKDRRRSFSPI